MASGSHPSRRRSGDPCHRSQGGRPVIWAVLALLGIPLWLIALVLVLSVWQRRAVLIRDDTFRYRIRTDRGWSRKRGVARWVSDVLIQYKGLGFIRTDARQITALEVAGPIADPVRGLGDGPVEMHLKFADPETKTLVVAVSADALTTAQGPFHGATDTNR